MKERLCNTVPMLCAPDGVSVVGVDVVGASVGVAAAHTHICIRFAAAPALVGRHGDVFRVPLPPVWYPHGYP